MQHTWWGGSNRPCPKCSSGSSQTGTFFNAEGQFRFQYLCPKCGECFNIDYSAGQIQAIAFDLDMEKYCAGCRAAPSVTALVVCPSDSVTAAVQWTDDDLKELRGMKILDPDDPKEEGR